MKIVEFSSALTPRNLRFLVLALLLSAQMPCFLAAQTPWILQGNNNVAPTNFLGPINAQPLRLGTQALQPVQFFSNNAERMRLGGNGLFGIGTTNPLYTFHVVNATNLRSGDFTNNFVSASQTYGLSSETSNTGTGA